jgi:hypothetical protein
MRTRGRACSVRAAKRRAAESPGLRVRREGSEGQSISRPLLRSPVGMLDLSCRRPLTWHGRPRQMRRREHLAPRLRTLRGRKAPQIEPLNWQRRGHCSLTSPQHRRSRSVQARSRPRPIATSRSLSTRPRPLSSTAASDQRAAAPRTDETPQPRCRNEARGAVAAGRRQQAGRSRLRALPTRGDVAACCCVHPAVRSRT